MALDQIWKQQLALVTYGNEYLAGNLNFSRWIEHPVFDQNRLIFRDLLSQHLLAQHFQIWLEGLKKQGVKKLSLHLSSVLNDEQNPNANVELLPFAHFIVSHQANKKTAWICGHELAEWDNSDSEFQAPASQQSVLRQEDLWRYELKDKFAKKIDADLKKVNWNEVAIFLERELFDSKYADNFIEPEQQDFPFYGYEIDPDDLSSQQLALIPTDYPADCAHRLLHRTQALVNHLEQQKKHPYTAAGELLSPEEQINLRNFLQKADDLFAKLIVKTANHYQTAQLTAEEPEIIDRTMEIPQQRNPTQQHHKVGASGVIKLILLTIIICVCAYYFGL
ncbi:hypothetical protein [Acinetobacter vivianii]|uniref:hypothetical protein n=1 Tax=Acinetobacter vivianii TaxID=1776742 RepID=UPI002DBFF0C7|nr:hypothetical protein [Acinetobacter vivianii]MEB6481084.1 hypothetical protein [Acinetobacter vivianii]MEB6659406.1 hypothetical protein [Acinetobacter vivianii]